MPVDTMVPELADDYAAFLKVDLTKEVRNVFFPTYSEVVVTDKITSNALVSQFSNPYYYHFLNIFIFLNSRCTIL